MAPTGHACFDRKAGKHGLCTCSKQASPPPLLQSSSYDFTASAQKTLYVGRVRFSFRQSSCFRVLKDSQFCRRMASLYSSISMQVCIGSGRGGLRKPFLPPLYPPSGFELHMCVYRTLKLREDTDRTGINFFSFSRFLLWVNPDARIYRVVINR